MSIPKHPAVSGPATGGFRPAAAALAAACIVVAALVWLSQPEPPPPLTAPDQPMMMTPWITPGIRLPAVQSSGEAVLPDEALVIGVAVGGKHRAYRVEAFHPISAHVVNDVIGETPISVTYCNRTECTHVFTDTTRGAPLKIDLGGYVQKMLLKVGDEFYFQDSGASIVENDGATIPYATHPFEKTTWKKWKEAHPDTELYMGLPPAKPIP